MISKPLIQKGALFYPYFGMNKLMYYVGKYGIYTLYGTILIHTKDVHYEASFLPATLQFSGEESER